MKSQPRRLTCGECLRPASLCLCPHIPRISNRTPVLVLQHQDEQKHALNTARLAVLGLVNAEIWIGDTFAALPARLNAARAAYLLFPGDDAVTPDQLNRSLATPIDHEASTPCLEHAPNLDALDRDALNRKPIAPDLLIVPDGTWRKARRILHANPALTPLARLTLKPTAASTYRLRKASEPDALSTIEAIVQTLSALEPTQDFLPLLRPFDVLIEQQIAAMGSETYARNYR